MKKSIRGALVVLRRKIFEACASARYSRPALHGLDRKTEQFLNRDGGFFVEAGANDGFQQSYTYYFERMRGWSGVLVEPVPELFERCRARRRRSKVFNAALVSADCKDESVLLHYAGLMSTVDDALGAATAAHVASGRECQEIERGYEVRVPARTLTSILDEAAAPREFDLLSLDVEGFEAEALRGLDLGKYRPRFMCIEVRDAAAIEQILGKSYRQVAVLTELGSHRDILYAAG